MQHFEDEIQSRDGARLYLQGWAPEQSTRAVVCLLHGLGEHSGRYAHVAAWLAQSGYALLTFDQRGHGRTTGQRGHFPSREKAHEDIDALLNEAERRYPGKPRFLYGHSMGGLLALDYATTRTPAIAGVISTSPGLRTALHEQKFKLRMARFLNATVPGFSMPSGLNEAYISRDPAVVEAYRKDALVHGVVTAGLGVCLLDAIQHSFDCAPRFGLPLLLMQGSADQIAYPRGAQEYAALAPGATLKMWEGCYHELHNEPEKNQVLAYLVGWLDAQL